MLCISGYIQANKLKQVFCYNFYLIYLLINVSVGHIYTIVCISFILIVFILIYEIIVNIYFLSHYWAPLRLREGRLKGLWELSRVRVAIKCVPSLLFQKIMNVPEIRISEPQIEMPNIQPLALLHNKIFIWYYLYRTVSAELIYKHCPQWSNWQADADNDVFVYSNKTLKC